MLRPHSPPARSAPARNSYSARHTSTHRTYVEFQRRLTILSDEAPTLFAGVQVLASDGIDFGNVPDHLRIELDAGRSGLDIAKELALELWTLGVTTFYLIPTIRRGGVRDYHSAADLVSYIRSLGVSLPTHSR